MGAALGAAPTLHVLKANPVSLMAAAKDMIEAHIGHAITSLTGVIRTETTASLMETLHDQFALAVRSETTALGIVEPQ